MNHMTDLGTGGAAPAHSPAPTAAVEPVVLVDEQGIPVGTAEKSEVHHRDTPLHLAFSCHLFDVDGRVLITRRALSKQAWPGVWTNSLCGHPLPDEPFPVAIRRRANDELGITVQSIEMVVPDFRYTATDASGVRENEYCPVFRATTTDPIAANPDEVMDQAWIQPADLATAIEAAPWALSPWLLQHAPLLPFLIGSNR